MDLQTITVLITGISVIAAAAYSVISSWRAEERLQLASSP